jgi:acyl-CoA synthetase (AMP-forming)/AMP-acid ligase II
MQAFGLYKIEAAIVSPGGLAEFLEYYEQSPAFQCHFKLIVSGGSMLRRELGRRVRARMCSNLISAYGSTEASVVASAPAVTIEPVDGAVGYVLPGIAMEAVDPNNIRLPAGQQGLIRIRAENAVTGHHGSVHATTFQDGWFYPGDRGAVLSDGLLVITGRDNEVLNVGGEKVNPERIEQSLASYPGVREAAVFATVSANGVDEICAVLVSSDAVNGSAIQTHCARSLPRECVPSRFVQLPALPRNSMGKLDRKRLSQIVGQ